jgi:hypothetical protein
MGLFSIQQSPVPLLLISVFQLPQILKHCPSLSSEHVNSRADTHHRLTLSGVGDLTILGLLLPSAFFYFSFLKLLHKTLVVSQVQIAPSCRR